MRSIGRLVTISTVGYGRHLSGDELKGEVISGVIIISGIAMISV